jgi:thiamine phosphate synthase YjbQ (UPF0047 family)
MASIEQHPSRAAYIIKHTSASLTLNENCDPVVTNDMEMAFNNIVPESKN